MNRIKLEVINLAKQDVISTSGLCKVHPNAVHLYTHSNNTVGSNMGVDQYLPGNLTSDSSYACNYDSFNPNLDNSTVAGKWYYLNGSKFEECSGNHDSYTKVIH